MNKLIHTFLNILYRYLLIVIDMFNMRKKKLSNRYNFKPLKKKNNNKVFILGSGYSIMGLSEENYNEIKKHTSIGFNYWIDNDFVPDIYVFEISKKKMYVFERFKKILMMKSSEYMYTKIFIKDFDNSINYDEILSGLDSKIKKNIFFLNEVFLPSRYEGYFKYAYALFNFLFKNTYILGRCRGTIFTCLQIASKLHANKIILCGIDLNDNRYFQDFYKSSRYKLPTVQKEPRLKDNIHPTNDPDYGYPTIEEVIKVFDEYNPFDIKTANPKSELANFLEEYNFKN